MWIVSRRLQRRIARDFPQRGSAEEVIRLLTDVSDSERVQAAIVLASNGDLREFKREAELAVIDLARRPNEWRSGARRLGRRPGLRTPAGPNILICRR